MNNQKELEIEIAKHLMQPENYGKLKGADCTGIGTDNTTQSYVIMYMNLSDTHILDVKFGSNSTQDVNTLGSLFTEMIKGDEIKNVLKSALGLEQNLQKSYSNLSEPQVDLTKPEGQQVEHVSSEYQDSANMVLTAFRAAMRHYERLQGGVMEEHFEMNIVKSCPYSGTKCHFSEENKD
ncbi:MAG: iron-sulfur cluster assembly scaffold protein [Sulfurimonas sp.]|nr:MAG: iron-sulfur cluster assembly scaffold protein [Sulfurimonas sp.]